MRKFIAYGLVWYSTTFNGPHALEDVTGFLNDLPVSRAKEAKVAQELQPEQYGVGIAYTIFYRTNDEMGILGEDE